MYGQVFQGVLNSRYLDALINSKKLVSDEIISRIAARNRCSYSFVFSFTAMSKAVKIKKYKTIVKSAVVFGSETWAVAEIDMNRLGAWERKY